MPIFPIILKGWEWFSSIGSEKSKGTKVFALAGKINNVGLIEVPMGTTLREVIFEIGVASRMASALRLFRPEVLPVDVSQSSISIPLLTTNILLQPVL